MAQAALPCSTVEPTQIAGSSKNGADIDQADTQRRRDLRDDLGFADAPAVQRGRRACRSCASTCSEDAISDGFMHGDLHDGLPWSVSPSTSRVTDFPRPSHSLQTAGEHRSQPVRAEAGAAGIASDVEHPRDGVL